MAFDAKVPVIGNAAVSLEDCGGAMNLVAKIADDAVADDAKTLAFLQ